MHETPFRTAGQFEFHSLIQAAFRAWCIRRPEWLWPGPLIIRREFRAFDEPFSSRRRTHLDRAKRRRRKQSRGDAPRSLPHGLISFRSLALDRVCGSADDHAQPIFSA
jgi:hypothetical protein